MPGLGFGYGYGAGGHNRRAHLAQGHETPTPTPTAPAAVSDLSAAPGDSRVTLHWSAPADGGSAITDYAVQYKRASSGTWLTLADDLSSVPGAVVPALANGMPHDFRVAAVNAIGMGPWSDLVTATPDSADLMIGPENYALADDFETPPGVTPMTGRAHWSGDTDKWVTDNGTSHQNVRFSPRVTALFGDGPWGDLDVRFDYRTGDADPVGSNAWEAHRQVYRVWQVDPTNRIDLNLDTTNRRVAASIVVDGVTTTRNFGDRSGTVGGSGVTIRRAGQLRVQIRNNRLRVWMDGKALTAGPFAPPWDYVDLATIITDPANRGGLVGAAQETYAWPVLDGIAVRAADIMCDGIDGAVGRDAYDRDEGTVTYTGRYAGTPVAWVSRLLDWADPSIVRRDWQAVTATLDAGSYSISEALPLGGPYLVEHGWLDADGLRHTTLSPPTLVARRIITYGQSTAVGRGGGGAYAFPKLPRGAVPASVYNVLANYTAGYMINGVDPFVSATQDKAVSFTTPFQQITDAPVMFEAYGNPGSTINGLTVGNPLWATFTAALATRKGVVEAVIWDQGQGDTDVAPASFASNLAAYPGRFLDGVVAPLRALFNRPTLPFFISHMGRYGGAPPSGLTQAQFDSQRDAFRKMAFSLTTEGGGSDPHIHSSSHHDGLLQGDTYHATDNPAGYGRLNERDVWSVAQRVLGLPVHDGRGPRPTGLSRSGAVLTIALDMGGATGLQEVTLDTRAGTSTYPAQPANRIKGWDFSLTRDFATLLPVASLVVAGNAIKVTLAADPGAPVYARNLYGAGYDDSVMVHGVYSGAAYDQTIPVEPTMAGPLVSN